MADLSPFDFVAAVAVGSIFVRVPNASDASWLGGAVTLTAVLAAHWCVTRLRRFPSVSHLLDHAPRLLVAHGQVLERELRRCGPTRSDLDAMLRQRGVGDLREARFVVFEQRGQLSVVRQGEPGGAAPDLVRRVPPPGGT